MHKDLIADLESGKVRAAYKVNDVWQVNLEVKESILSIFQNSPTVPMAGGFKDKEPLVMQNLQQRDLIRIVPGGTAIRAGAYIGEKVVIMPPSYVNIGAYIDDSTMIDSHVLVGSCAQIGKNVHLSAAVQIGGVLEPIGNRPVIIEDNCFIGAGSIITEGVLIRSGAVLGAGVHLSASVPIFDIVNQKIYKKEIPANAVVISGSRCLDKGWWAQEHGLAAYCAMIVKYRDHKTDISVILENALREI